MESAEVYLAGNCQPAPQHIPPEMKLGDVKNADFFPIEDLFDFSNEEESTMIDALTGNFSANSSTISAAQTAESCNSSLCGDAPHLTNSHFPGDICVPYDALLELEWLSNFVEQSFSGNDFQKLQIVSGINAEDDPDVGGRCKLSPVATSGSSSARSPNTSFNPVPAMFPAKARSKRSRSAACNWTSELIALCDTNAVAEVVRPVPVPRMVGRERHLAEHFEGRKCLHCASDKTPQWRTGPLGPKTLCNACGVRYKSGRLVPEYRPAASPTFVLTKHSNSHRKVLELRRHKQMQRSQKQVLQQAIGVDDVSAGNDAGGEFLLIHTGADFRHQLI